MTSQYDANGRITTLALMLGGTMTYEYDSLGRVITQMEYNAGGSKVLTIVDTYDAAGRKTNQTVDGDVTTYVYDNANRLTSQQGGSYATFTMDEVGNILVKNQSGSNPMTFVYDAGSRITTMQQGTVLTTYTYDDNGNLTAETPSSGSTTNNLYGRENRLKENDVITTGRHLRITYTYDGDGLRRVRKGQEVSLNLTTYIWDGSDYLGEVTN
jgi:YD repeat-containing protein